MGNDARIPGVEAKEPPRECGLLVQGHAGIVRHAKPRDGVFAAVSLVAREEVLKLSKIRTRPLRRALALIGVTTVGWFGATGIASPSGDAFATSRADTAELASADTTPERIELADSLFGLSGKLHMRFLAAAKGEIALPALQKLFGDTAIAAPGVHKLAQTQRPFSIVTLVPFTEKKNGRIGTYRIGSWPGERGRVASEAYENPEGFIVVTPENQNEPVSEHFRLRDFLTKDQREVWPKYLVLDLQLIDKLELLIDELNSSGVKVEHMSVMSGFRTPQYNANGGSTAGRATLSRHMYGDAADVFVDNDRNGRMDDISGDGRVDHRDAQVILNAVERLDRKYPQLVGGVGVYKATAAHGPFAHVDVRGSRARWGV